MSKRMSLSLSAQIARTLRAVVPGQNRTGEQRFGSLDGLRAIAAIMVLVFHLSELKGGQIAIPYSVGNSAVYLFFVLSSFLLTGQLLHLNPGLQDYRIWLNYACRRLLRIYPLYIFVLLSYTLSKSFRYSFIDVLNHIFWLQGNNQFWTIPVEMKYYLLMPIVTLVFTKILRNDVPKAAILTGGLILANWLYCTVVQDPSFISIWTNFPPFLLGSLAALIYAKLPKPSELKPQSLNYRYALEALSLGLLLVGMGLFPSIWSWVPPGRSPFSQIGPINCILFGSLWAIFIVAHLYGIGLIKKVLSLQILRWLSQISFGIYLWNTPIIAYLDTHLNLPILLKAGCICCVTVIVATLTYLLIERPLMQIKILRLNRASA